MLYTCIAPLTIGKTKHANIDDTRLILYETWCRTESAFFPIRFARSPLQHNMYCVSVCVCRSVNTRCVIRRSNNVKRRRFKTPVFMCVCMGVSPSTYTQNTSGRKTNGIRIKTLNVSNEQVTQTQPPRRRAKRKNNKNSDPDLFRVVHIHTHTHPRSQFYLKLNSFIFFPPRVFLPCITYTTAFLPRPFFFVVPLVLRLCVYAWFLRRQRQINDPPTNKHNKNINLNHHHHLYPPAPLVIRYFVFTSENFIFLKALS